MGTTRGYVPKWALDERHIYFLNFTGTRYDVWRVDVESHEERAMTDLAGRPGRMSASALATDGTHLYFAWGSDTGDLWVMDVVP